MNSLSNIYDLTLKTLKRHSSLSEAEFEEKIEEWRNYPNRFQTDNDFFELLVEITFYSGFKAKTVKKGLDKIKEHLGNYKEVKEYTFEDVESILKHLKNKDAIANAPKVCLTILNARKFHKIVTKYGSFKGYLRHHNFEQGVWNKGLYEDLKKFHYLGEVTAYHFLMDIGAFCIKPDRQIVALLKDLGLIKENEKRKPKSAVDIGQQIAQETGEKIRVVDIVLVTMRQGEELGLKDPVCKDHCKKCLLYEICSGKKESS